MSSDGIVSKEYFNSNYVVNLNEKKLIKVFDLIGNMEKRLVELANRFRELSFKRNTDVVYIEIGSCFIHIASELRKIKKGLKE